MEAIRIRTDQAVPGMKVAEDVYTANNLLVINKGTILDDRIITKLRYYNIYGLYVFEKENMPEEDNEDSYIDMLRNTIEFKKIQ